MPSTYTSNTGIEKIATGEQSGTWGDTTNLNFDIIDRALNGSVTISLSGTTHTLATTDGTLSDGMYKLLVLGGTPSGANTITITPNDAQKIYFVYNNSGQDAIFTQGSGGNVTIEDGQYKVIYSDGGGAGAAVTEFEVTGGGGASGGGGSIYVNADVVTESYTIAAGTNGFSVGPITVNDAVTVTVADGQRWVVL